MLRHSFFFLFSFALLRLCERWFDFAFEVLCTSVSLREAAFDLLVRMKNMSRAPISVAATE